MGEFWIAIAILLIGLSFYTFRILREYERGVIFFLGRFQTVKGPGLIIVIPGLQQMVRVDLRTVVYDVPTQDVISRDNVSVKVSAVIYFRSPTRSGRLSMSKTFSRQQANWPRPHCVRFSVSTNWTRCWRSATN